MMKSICNNLVKCRTINDALVSRLHHKAVCQEVVKGIAAKSFSTIVISNLRAIDCIAELLTIVEVFLSVRYMIWLMTIIAKQEAYLSQVFYNHPSSKSHQHRFLGCQFNGSTIYVVFPCFFFAIGRQFFGGRTC